MNLKKLSGGIISILGLVWSSVCFAQIMVAPNVSYAGIGAAGAAGISALKLNLCDIAPMTLNTAWLADLPAPAAIPDSQSVPQVVRSVPVRTRESGAYLRLKQAEAKRDLAVLQKYYKGTMKNMINEERAPETIMVAGNEVSISHADAYIQGLKAEIAELDKALIGSSSWRLAEAKRDLAILEAYNSWGMTSVIYGTKTGQEPITVAGNSVSIFAVDAYIQGLKVEIVELDKVLKGSSSERLAEVKRDLAILKAYNAGGMENIIHGQRAPEPIMVGGNTVSISEVDAHVRSLKAEMAELEARPD